MESGNDKKLKKTRRGKKSGRRSRGRSWSEDCGNGALNILCNPPNSKSIHEQSETHGLDITRVKFHSPYNVNEQTIKGHNRRCIRPRYSPKAPHNSTQFIMEDHECEYNHISGGQGLSEYPDLLDDFYCCRDEDLSKKSESDSMYTPKRKCPSVASVGTESNDCSANSDLEMYVENLQIDNTFVFMANDFENCYHNARTEELSRLSRENLVEQIIDMENKVVELEKNLSNQNLNEKTESHTKKSDVMCDLLKQLQSLRKENRSLKQMKIDAGI